MANSGIIGSAWGVFEPHLREQGYELVEVEYVPQGRRQILRIFIDKDGGGITLDDCTAASQLLGTLLDADDFVHTQYVLEVSSPGIARPLRKPADFLRFSGEKVRVLSHGPVSGRRKFTGILRGFRDGLIVLDCDGKTFEIHIENLKKANLDR